MKKIILCLMLPLALFGSELVFQFKSPTFTGVGYSAHKLTLEQISFNRKSFKDAEEDLGALLFAGMLVEGGIISYESNIVSGGIGASYLGIGASKQYRKDNVTVSMRFVSVNSGQILLSSTVSKTILSVGTGATFFKYFDTDELNLGEFNDFGEAEIGYARNERVSIATRKAIDACIIDLMIQGDEKGLWNFVE